MSGREMNEWHIENSSIDVWDVLEIFLECPHPTAVAIDHGMV